MNTNAFQASQPVRFSKPRKKYILKEGWQTAIEMALLTKLKYFGYKTPTRKKATCLWFLSEASCAGVRPVLSVTIRSSFLPACTNTVQASKLPLIAAQWRGVQPEYIKEDKNYNIALKIKDQFINYVRAWKFQHNNRMHWTIEHTFFILTSPMCIKK